jgi:hypothetical protein
MLLESTLEHVAQIDLDILSELEQLGTCTFEELAAALPEYTLTNVFAAVDRLSHDGRLALTRQGNFDYRISIVLCGAGHA